jgi:hypothetical protein
MPLIVLELNQSNWGRNATSFQGNFRISDFRKHIGVRDNF